jgi:hypothetical protein
MNRSPLEEDVMRSNRSLEIALLAIVSVLISSVASAAISNFTGTLDNVQEQAAGECLIGSSAMGQVTATLDTATNLMTYSATFGNNAPDYDNGLVDQGVELVAHFHISPAGATGAVLFIVPAGTPKNGSETISASDAAELEAGNVYLNVHSTGCTAGEIRAQLNKIAAVPAFAESTWQLGLTLSLLATGCGVIWYRRNALAT